MGAGASAQTAEPITPVVSVPDNPRPHGPPMPVSLAEVVALALRDNRTIRSAYLDRVAQKFDLVVANSRFQPRINLAADVFSSRLGGITSLQSTVSPTVTWRAPTGATAQFVWARAEQLDGPGGRVETTSLVVAQPLLRGGGFATNLAPLRIAALQNQINHLNLESTVSNIVTNVVFAYRSLLQAQEQARLSQLALERTQAIVATSQALIDAGRMAAADIVQAESGVANQQVAVIQAGQQVRSAQLALLQLVAVDPRTNIVAGDAITVTRLPIDVERAVVLGLDARMDVLAQRKALEQNRQSLIVARNNRLWDLSVVGTLDRSTGRDPLLGPIDGRTNRTVGVQLSVPIGEPAFKQGEIQATTNLRTAELRYEDLLQAAETQVRDAVQAADASWLQVEAARRAQSLAQRALDVQREKLKVGRSSNFEVLSFQADLRAADTQALSAEIAYLNALTSLDQQLGSTIATWQIEVND